MWTRKDSGFRQFSRSDFRIIKAFQNFFFRFCNLLFLGHLESEMKNFKEETGKSLERTNNIISELCLELLCCLPLPEFIHEDHVSCVNVIKSTAHFNSFNPHHA